MNIEFNCPECGQLLAVDSTYAGAKVECPKCKTEGQVPEAKPVSKPVGSEKGIDISEEEKPWLEAQPNEAEKVARGAIKCSKCGETVSNRAIVCKSCGSRLERAQQEKSPPESSHKKTSGLRVVWGCGVFLLGSIILAALQTFNIQLGGIAAVLFMLAFLFLFDKAVGLNWFGKNK